MNIQRLMRFEVFLKGVFTNSLTFTRAIAISSLFMSSLRWRNTVYEHPFYIKYKFSRDLVKAT
jgi:hypothetical protein